MALAPAGSGGESVIEEVEMNAGADQGGATVRVTVVQASSVFYDTPATLGACGFALSARGCFNCGSSAHSARFIVWPVWHACSGVWIGAVRKVLDCLSRQN